MCACTLTHRSFCNIWDYYCAVRFLTWYQNRKMQGENVDVRETRNADHYGALIHHLALIRNKRCLMVYVWVFLKWHFMGKQFLVVLFWGLPYQQLIFIFYKYCRYNRAEIIRNLAWKVGLELLELPEEIQEKISHSEKNYYAKHSAALQSYMADVGIDLNVVSSLFLS